jgi:hypothetical protein
LRRRSLPSRVVTRRIEHCSLPVGEWSLLNVAELSGLIGWPIGVRGVPGLRLSGYRQMPPTPAIPKSGTVVADSTYPGTDRPIALDVEARLRHVHVLGPTGVGKSTLLANIIVTDIRDGHGVIVIDAKTDLVADVLARVPARRQDDVIVLDPADTMRPVGINPLQTNDGVSGEVAVENLVAILHSLNQPRGVHALPTSCAPPCSRSSALKARRSARSRSSSPTRPTGDGWSPSSMIPRA